MLERLPGHAGHKPARCLDFNFAFTVGRSSQAARIRNHSQAELLLPPSSVRTAFPEVNRGKVAEKSLLGSSFFSCVLPEKALERQKCKHSCCWSRPAEGQHLLCHTAPSPAPSPAVQLAARGSSRKAARLCDLGWISQAAMHCLHFLGPSQSKGAAVPVVCVLPDTEPTWVLECSVFSHSLVSSPKKEVRGAHR